MNRQEYQVKKNNEATGFFRKFIGWVTKGRVRVTHFGYWHIGGGKFGLSMYFEADSEEL